MSNFIETKNRVNTEKDDNGQGQVFIRTYWRWNNPSRMAYITMPTEFFELVFNKIRSR